ncbi:MAG: hypothetical protein SWY16_03940 [Cyanobacteriota bacterium]|nr:hypothetical protein [Cyanobacteriota bacterium]
MLPKLLNLTLLYVTQEVNQILNEYPVYPYQKAFAKPKLRQQLIARVLSQIPNRHIVMDESEDLPQYFNYPQCWLDRTENFYHHAKFPPCAAAEQLRIENLIYEAIFDLMPTTLNPIAADSAYLEKKL